MDIKYLAYLTLVILFSIVTSCNNEDEEASPSEPPTVITSDAIQNEGEVVVLSGSYESNGNEIIRVGFEYGPTSNFTDERSQVSAMTGTEDLTFSYEIQDGLTRNTYAYRAFIETDSIIYGETKTFDFVGYTPSILEIIPEMADYEDTISIVGSNFKDAAEETIVQFSGVRATTITASILDLNDTIMVVLVPLNLETIASSVLVKVGNRQSLPHTFTINDPEITEIAPVVGTDGTPITIKGKNFGFSPDSIQVMIGDYSMDIESFSNYEIVAIIPHNIPVEKYPIAIQSYGREVSYIGEFEIKPPEIVSYTPEEGFDRTEVNIEGNFLGPLDSRNVYINGILCETVNSSESSMTVLSPETTFSGDTELVVEVGAKRSTEHPFQVLIQEIVSISPENGKIGGTMLVEGERLAVNGYQPILFINGVETRAYDFSETSFKFLVPYMLGEANISLTLGQKSIEYTNSLVIEESWANHSTAINHSVQFPMICQVSEKVYYGLGGEDGSFEFYTDFWEFNTNTQEWRQLQPVPNSEMQGANPYYKHLIEHKGALHLFVSFENTGISQHYKYNIQEDSWVRLNDSGVREFRWVISYQNKIYAAALFGSSGVDPKMYVYSDESDQWDFLYDLSFRPPLFHFELEERIFVFPQISDGDFYELNIETGQFLRKSDFPGNYWSYATTEKHTFSINGDGYLIVRNDPIEVWRYLPEEDIWIQNQSFHDRRSHSLSYLKNGLIFFGLGDVSGAESNEIWSFTK